MKYLLLTLLLSNLAYSKQVIVISKTWVGYYDSEKDTAPSCKSYDGGNLDKYEKALVMLSSSINCEKKEMEIDDE